MQLKNKLITIASLVLCTGIIGAGTANAATPQSSRISGLQGQVSAAPQSMAVESGGPNSSGSSSVSDILSGISSVVRSSGGAGVIGKTLQCIYNTARMCPECFYL
jgi:hypothetical protein